MKVRICPKCQKHNRESVCECEACGGTLPMSCLVDTASLNSVNMTSTGGQSLSNISPFFQQDFQEHKESMIQGDEFLARGFNVTQPGRFGPYKFGYILITSKRLIIVFFKAKPAEGRSLASSLFFAGILPKMNTKKSPARPFLKIYPTARSMQPMIALDYPRDPLTSMERATRQVECFDLSDLNITGFDSVGIGETLLSNLVLENKKRKEIVLTFYMYHEAEEACQWIKRSQSAIKA